MNVKDMLRQASDAAKRLITLSDQTIIGILKETAQVLRTHTEEVLAANRQDLERMDPANPKYDRLKLTEESYKVSPPIWRMYRHYLLH